MRPAGPTRLATASWMIYDLANTIFALGVVGLYFSDWLVSEGHPDSYLAGVQAAAAAVSTAHRRLNSIRPPTGGSRRC